MIPLLLKGTAETKARFVVRLREYADLDTDAKDAVLAERSLGSRLFSSHRGTIRIDVDQATDLDGDVVVVDGIRGTVERLLRAGSKNNTLLITERCDQLCVMCSQPPKKTHVDRFAEYAEACKMAPFGDTIGLSGGEPTLYKEELFNFLREVSADRPDLCFHILTNGQHFTQDDRSNLLMARRANVTWGVPIYSHTASEHDRIVGKEGAFKSLCSGLEQLLLTASHVELRTVVLQENLQSLPLLARLISSHMTFCVQWSIMQLENIGFAAKRFQQLFVNHYSSFDPIAEALDVAELAGVSAVLFNFPRCGVPVEYRRYAVSSISDWKRKYSPACVSCNEIDQCGGFFEWQPSEMMEVRPL